MTCPIPQAVDTLVVGNGPSALLLSYILHGHIPTYDLSNPHPDPILHEKLKGTKDLLNLDINHLTEHFPASRFSYSTQALPVNVLYDTLIRPYGETEQQASCVKWQFDASRAVQHVVVGNTRRPGGQWVDNPVDASWEIGTLSYANMLSLPGYRFGEYYKELYGLELPSYLRPPRKMVADYFALYPARVGIAESIHNGVKLSHCTRAPGGFYFASHGITCKHLVLASGIFSQLIPPRPLLQSLSALSQTPDQQTDAPILVIGSGFSAADVIISTPAKQKIIHIFKWDPVHAPSPLRACHQEAYPEYAGVYRRMKLAALASSSSRDPRPKFGRRRSSAFDLSRDWNISYEGLPNTEVIEVRMAASDAVITLRDDAQEVFDRQISRLAYVVGRRGSLDYLGSDLLKEINVGEADAGLLSGHVLRQKASEDLEVAPGVFVIGSLTGDSLIRFAYGSCAHAVGQIFPGHCRLTQLTKAESKCLESKQTLSDSILLNGLEGHNSSPHSRQEKLQPLDRRKENAQDQRAVIESKGSDDGA